MRRQPTLSSRSKDASTRSQNPPTNTETLQFQGPNIPKTLLSPAYQMLPGDVEVNIGRYHCNRPEPEDNETFAQNPERSSRQTQPRHGTNADRQGGRGNSDEPFEIFPWLGVHNEKLPTIFDHVGVAFLRCESRNPCDRPERCTPSPPRDTQPGSSGRGVETVLTSCYRAIDP